ncbi:MAG TPA: hypothetical protein VGX23_29910 [Actinocrinis sp.]|nr:hypothetical protein [Actinocrinis sp.]
MTNEELFNDLKQFIDAKLSQERAHTDEQLGKVQDDIKRLDTKIDQVQDGIGDTLVKLTKALDVTKEVRDHERRLTRLEHRVA